MRLRFHGLILALSLMTSLPVSVKKSYGDFDDRDCAMSPLWYPVVGFILAILLLAFYWLLLQFRLSPGIYAAFVLSAWVVVTGALHLDGLADCSDAWFAAHKSPGRALQVMRDPHIGAMAAVSVTLVLLLKFALLQQLATVPIHFAKAIVTSLVLPRLSALFYMLTTPYARQSGIAEKLKPSQCMTEILVLSASVSAMTFLLWPGYSSVFVIACLCLFLWWWRRHWFEYIGGYTGDCLGASIEIAETLILAAAVIFL